MNELPITFILMPVAAGLGTLFVLISVPLLYNTIGPNWAYGFRTRKTLSNPEIWYKANNYMTKELIAAGIAIVLLSIIMMAVHIKITMFTPEQAVGLFLMVLGVPLAIAIVRSTWYLKRL